MKYNFFTYLIVLSVLFLIIFISIFCISFTILKYKSNNKSGYLEASNRSNFIYKPLLKISTLNLSLSIINENLIKECGKPSYPSSQRKKRIISGSQAIPHRFNKVFKYFHFLYKNQIK